MQAFVDHPAEWAKFRNNVDDSDYVVSAVEEMLRWVTPIKNMARTVMAQVEFHGQMLEVDDQLILLYPSANRDERVFDDPFTFDIERSSNQHLAFGFGTHFCLGASLARLELRVMFEQLAKRLPDLTTVGNEPEPWRNSNFITGAESMPVSFTPTPRVRN
jgi:cytochrome P450 family 142 subfamily A polypeptide 1